MRTVLIFPASSSSVNLIKLAVEAFHSHHLGFDFVLRGLFGRRGLAVATRRPPGLRTPNERRCVSPPIRSNTRSTFLATDSKGVAL